MSASQGEITRNMNAFLDMISFSEGTNIAGSDDGYNVVVGGTLFDDYSQHPRIFVDLPKLNIRSSAAGRYQILFKYAQVYTKQLRLKDFGPVSQDQIAIQLIRECGALELIATGKITRAIKLCSSRWASFPGNNYGQRTESTHKLVEFYKAAGGYYNE